MNEIALGRALKGRVASHTHAMEEKQEASGDYSEHSVPSTGDRTDDSHLDTDLAEKPECAVESGDEKGIATLEHEVEDDSPYLEVRAAVSNVDDPEMPVNTLRAWLIGLVAMIVTPGVNKLLQLRFPSTTITGYVIIIFAYPAGKLLEKILPTATLRTRFGHFTLNPGPFNVKEHSVISIMALMSTQSQYATNILGVQKFIYHQDPSIGYGILLTLGTQLIGLSFAYFLRRFLVYPSSMIYPTNLPKATLLNSLHSRDTSAETERGMSRYKFFWIAFAVLFCWQFFPGYIFTMLSAGSWFCLIAPNNVPLNHVFGTNTLGLIPLTLDWQTISQTQDPLASPWWAEANMFGGYVLFFLIVAPAMYYTNVGFQKYLPLFESTTYDRFGQEFNVTRVTRLLDSGGLEFLPEEYNNYSQMYMPTAQVVSYMLSFASVSAVIVHVALFHGKAIWRQLRTPLDAQVDVHARLMSRYKEVPAWWFGALFAIAFGMGMAALYNWESETDLPGWAFVIAIIIGAVLLLPIGVVYALANQEVGLNVISELICGYMLPGRPISMMVFKTTMYMVSSQGIMFVSDQKLGHYMKIPPRTVFTTQMLATVIGAVVQVLVQQWSIDNIPDVCTKKARKTNKFSCENFQAFGAASKIWGLIGPRALFDSGRQYNYVLYGFLVGAIAPIPLWLLTRRYPNSFLRLVNFPVIFSSTGAIPPATGMMFTAPALWGFIFQFVIKRTQRAWWVKYNYILSAALNAGTTIATVVIFFALQMPSGPTRDFYSNGWWGNTAWQNTADSNSTPYWKAPAGGFEGTPNEIGQTI